VFNLNLSLLEQFLKDCIVILQGSTIQQELIIEYCYVSPIT
jgi:hypothetical protein